MVVTVIKGYTPGKGKPHVHRYRGDREEPEWPRGERLGSLGICMAVRWWWFGVVLQVSRLEAVVPCRE